MAFTNSLTWSVQMVTLMMMICCLLPRLSLCVVLQNVCHDVMLIWCCWCCYDDDVDDDQNDGDDDVDENASASVFLSRSTKCVTWYIIYDVNLMMMMTMIIKMMMMMIMLPCLSLCLVHQNVCHPHQRGIVTQLLFSGTQTKYKSK